VSIEAGDAAVERIKDIVASTKRPEVMGGIGGFGGLFALDTSKYTSPVLVASADGVGTKLDIARQVGRYDTVGIDLVAMWSTISPASARSPLSLDYVAVGKLEPARLEELVTGIAEGCRTANTSLLGGETAEHAGVMAPDDLDVAGFAVGVVERGDELGPERACDGDVLVGFASPGLRSNGYSLARRVLVNNVGDLSAPAWDGADHSLGDELLVPSVIYSPTVTALRHDLGGAVHAAAHITGGGDRRQCRSDPEPRTRRTDRLGQFRDTADLLRDPAPRSRARRRDGSRLQLRTGHGGGPGRWRRGRGDVDRARQRSLRDGVGSLRSGTGRWCCHE